MEKNRKSVLKKLSLFVFLFSLIALSAFWLLKPKQKPPSFLYLIVDKNYSGSIYIHHDSRFGKQLSIQNGIGYLTLEDSSVKLNADLSNTEINILNKEESMNIIGNSSFIVKQNPRVSFMTRDASMDCSKIIRIDLDPAK